MAGWAKWTGFAACLLAAGAAEAAYVGSPPLLVGVVNPSGQTIGTNPIGTFGLPVTTSVIPPLSAFPSPAPLLSRSAIFPEVIGRSAIEITDGLQVASIAQPYRGAAAATPALVVAISPNAALQCPFIAPINQTANTTVITNPGGKLIHVCSVLILNATAQGVSINEGTGTTCGTGTIFWDGGSGGTGQLATTGGFLSAGDRITYPMQKAGDNVCVIQSGSTNVSGHLTYGIFQQ